MSDDVVKQIIARAVTDPEFRQLLLSDSAKALEGSELTDEERAALIGLTPQEFEALGSELEERVSRAQLTPSRGKSGAVTCYCPGTTGQC